jgi:hypothetical protein
MSVCDICNNEIKMTELKYNSTVMKKAVEAGFRPPKSAIDEMAAEKFGRESVKYLEAGWIEQVMNDDSDWLLCSDCSVEMESSLKKKKKKRSFFRSKKKETTGICQKCDRGVKLVGDQIAEGHVPSFTKDDIKGVGFYCSSCLKIFCGACSLPALTLNTPGAQVGMPECPICHKRVDWANNTHVTNLQILDD